jgi:hypothetical protein
MVSPCNHKFHIACLLEWMSVKMECPTCRNILPPIWLYEILLFYVTYIFYKNHLYIAITNLKAFILLVTVNYIIL